MPCYNEGNGDFVVATSPEVHPTVTTPQPAWEVAFLFPSQGEWSENDYLGLDTNRLVELVNGNLEVLPMPTYEHQLIVWYLAEVLRAFISRQHPGTVVFAPMPMRIRPKTFREPDVAYVPAGLGAKPRDKQLMGASLVMEVVSEDDKSHKRDYQEKRSDYAELGVPEYWIVDPYAERITVLILDASQYRIHGEFAPGLMAYSQLLPGFAVDVSAVFAAGRAVP